MAYRCFEVAVNDGSHLMIVGDERDDASPQFFTVDGQPLKVETPVDCTSGDVDLPKWWAPPKEDAVAPRSGSTTVADLVARLTDDEQALFVEAWPSVVKMLASVEVVDPARTRALSA